MRDQQLSHQCIEFRSTSPRRDVHYFSVKEYDDALAHRDSKDPKNPWSWTPGAPAVEKLTNEWHFTLRGKLRIKDQGVYEIQMAQLIGLDPEAPAWVLDKYP